MKNKTSGLKYVGQTFNLTTRSYCGSGQYWVAHCKKHGGHGRANIEIVRKFWAENEEQAQQWLDAFEAENPDYFERGNSAWANRARETTGDSAFCGVAMEQRVEYARAGGLATARTPGHMTRMASIQGRINADPGHMRRIQKIGASLGGKVAGSIVGRMMVESGQLDSIKSMGGLAVCTKRHADKDPLTGKSRFAVEMGSSSGVTRKLMQKFCEETGVKKPGTNYVNMDKVAFEQWRARHVG